MKYFLFFLTFSFIFIYGCDRPSKNVLFSDFPEGASKEYSVIGVSAFYDKEMINKNYTFYINDDIGLKSLKDSLIAGSEAYTMSPDDKMFHVFLVKGKEMLNPSIHINPNNENIIFNGRYFDFDPGQLLRLNKKYPVNYSLESIEFSTQTECEHFLSEHQNDDRLLCYKNITSVYNGEATV